LEAKLILNVPTKIHPGALAQEPERGVGLGQKNRDEREVRCARLAVERGVRLAKRHDALSLRALRESGRSPESVIASFGQAPALAKAPPPPAA
jgi:hypothetical protein